MSAVLSATTPSAWPPVAPALEARFEPMAAERLDAVLAIEQNVYSHPWSRRNFADTLAAGHQAQCLVGPLPDGSEDLIGYFVAMQGHEEVHLLNITVAAGHQRQGWALVMLDALALWSRARGAHWLWLEVRASNTRAQQIYLKRGFARVGLRKAYYPAGHGLREDAVVMNLRLGDGA
ncbi:ribosomal protein S18-alanine N-acetyltransferase [Ottowia beijingensis]|uniref:[Ribosomal protein bS18]-alanine N-acetyltransferase n=1 Tax=Ottowia beijingensis TaxID=1207057 RepID=A0A853IWF0_9BURK|nr:ribosomal protein S18-alanine N-acetyltransferase [Ottowia beijingensis]NZA02027.1 ribosomal protein S18-alanine N-acetyltransferase [Ottowia beijingensis]